MNTHLIECVETGKKTKIEIPSDEFTDVGNDVWTSDDFVNNACNDLLRREREHKYDFVVISRKKLTSEIMHGLNGDLTEHTGEYRSFKIIKISAVSRAAAALGSIKSPKKAASSRENGKKGGRPKAEKYECDTCGKLITDAQSNFYEYGRHCTKCYQSLTAK